MPRSREGLGWLRSGVVVVSVSATACVSPAIPGNLRFARRPPASMDHFDCLAVVVEGDPSGDEDAWAEAKESLAAEVQGALRRRANIPPVVQKPGDACLVLAIRVDAFSHVSHSNRMWWGGAAGRAIAGKAYLDAHLELIGLDGTPLAMGVVETPALPEECAGGTRAACSSFWEEQDPHAASTEGNIATLARLASNFVAGRSGID